MDKKAQQTNTTSGDNSAEQDFPEELRLIALRYAAQPVPRPTPKANQKLMSQLLVAETDITHTEERLRPSIGYTLRMARWQLHLLGPWFWITSVLLLLLGFLVAPNHKAGTINTLIILLPLTALLSVIYALRKLKSDVWEVEASCPTSIVEVLAGLALAIVCFDSLLGLIATIGLALLQWAPFTPLLTTWLGPLLLLVSISFPVALRWGAIPAMVVGGGPWSLLATIALLFPGSPLSQILLVQQNSISITAHLLAACLGMLILLLLLGYGTNLQRILLSSGIQPRTH